MKTLLLLAAASLLTPACAQETVPPQSRLHVQTSFDLTINAPYAEVAPLFGPNGERAWAGKHWNPDFIHPLPGKDVEGAIFTVKHGPSSAVWVNTLMDVEARHFQYVYFLPDIMVTVIDVRFTVKQDNSTGVNVVYTRTAVSPSGDEHVETMSEDDKAAGNDWQHAIDAYLSRSKPPR